MRLKAALLWGLAVTTSSPSAEVRSSTSLRRQLHPASLFAATTELSPGGILVAQGRAGLVPCSTQMDVDLLDPALIVLCTIYLIPSHMWPGLSLAKAFQLKMACSKLEHSGTSAPQDSSGFCMHMFYGGAGPRQAQMDSRLMESTFQTSSV